MTAKKLLFSVTKNQFVVEAIRSSGPGGQNVNKTATKVRIYHPASGAAAECDETRSQPENRKRAFLHLTKGKRFQAWLRLEIARRMTGKTVEDVVEDAMRPEYLKVEVVGADDKWHAEVPS